MTLFSKTHRTNTFSGILFVLLFAWACTYLAALPFLHQAGISSLIIAILLGMFYGNTLGHRLPQEWRPGIQFSGKKILRLAIILYGFRINFQQIASVGLPGLLLDCIVVTLTLAGGIFIGVKLFKIDHKLAILISAGAAICGAAAVLAVEDTIKSEPHKTSVAIGTVVIFGTLAMFLYPFLQQTGIFHFTDTQFGMFAGASVHEVAQALVAGEKVSQEAGNIAVIVKMTRVLLLIPVLLVLSFYQSRSNTKSGHSSKMIIPWFAIGFALMIGVNSLHIVPEAWVRGINQLDIFLLTMAMAAIGMETHFSKMKTVGVQPFYLASLLFVGLTTGVYFLVTQIGI